MHCSDATKIQRVCQFHHRRINTILYLFLKNDRQYVIWRIFRHRLNRISGIGIGRQKMIQLGIGGIRSIAKLYMLLHGIYIYRNDFDVFHPQDSFAYCIGCIRCSCPVDIIILPHFLPCCQGNPPDCRWQGMLFVYFVHKQAFEFVQAYKSEKTGTFLSMQCQESGASGVFRLEASKRRRIYGKGVWNR